MKLRRPPVALRTLTKSMLALCGLSGGLPALSLAAVAPATEVTPASSEVVALEFNEQLLAQGGTRKIDISRFATGNPMLPGVYRSDVYLNGTWLGRFDVRIAAGKPGSVPAPCLDRALVNRLGIDPTKLTLLGKTLIAGPQGDAADNSASWSNQCQNLPDIVEGGVARFDPSEQRLDMTVPQAQLARKARGYVPPEAWDRGITAATLGYNFNDFRSSNNGRTTFNSYLGLNAGLNVGDWHLRHNASVTDSSSTGTDYQQIATYLERDLVDWKSDLKLGDSFSDGQLFDSFSVRGVTLASDDRMLPESQRGYAPAIRGEATSRAKVEVRQNGVLIYDTIVPPGPFEITDLYPTGYGGDLIVTVTEADGTQHAFTVAFSATPMLLREGNWRYSVSAGKLRQTQREHNAIEGGVQYGLNNTVTLEGGLEVSNGYVALLGGAAINSPAGAWALDYTSSHLNLPTQGEQVGGSIRGSWAKTFPGTQTNFSFAAYRYSSQHFYDLANAVLAQDSDRNGLNFGSTQMRIRSQEILSVSQGLGRWGNLNVSGYSRTYWDLVGDYTGYQVNLAHRFGPAQVTLGFGRDEVTGSSSTNHVSLGLTMPLGFLGNGALASSVQHATNQPTTYQASVTGSAFDNASLGYGLYDTKTDGQKDVVSASLSYNSPVAQIGGSLGNNTSGGTQATLTASGGVVIHGGGVTFAPYLGDTIGLVQVEPGSGINVTGVQMTHSDWNGYTVLPFLTPYAINTVDLDYSKASYDAQTTASSQQVAPHAGAVVKLKFAGPTGRLVLIRGTLEDKSPLPFGASVYDAGGQQVGYVGQAGVIEVHVEKDAGSLRVGWGEGAQQACELSYTLPPVDRASLALPVRQEVVCHVRSAPGGSHVAAASAAAGGAEPTARKPLASDGVAQRKTGQNPGLTVIGPDGQPILSGEVAVSPTVGVKVSSAQAAAGDQQSEHAMPARWLTDGGHPDTL